jgi:hypothetical protein
VLLTHKTTSEINSRVIYLSPDEHTHTHTHTHTHQPLLHIHAKQKKYPSVLLFVTLSSILLERSSGWNEEI